MRKPFIKYFVYLVLLYVSMASCKKEQERPLSVDFTYDIVNNDLSAPVKINFTNNTTGATHYKWTFTGGERASSDQKDPGTITFATAGNCSVTLEAWNADNRNSKTVDILIDSSVTIGFDALPQINDFVPADVTIINKSTGGVSYKWTFEGGQPATATAKDPGVIKFNTPGDHTFTLVVNNGRKDFTLTKVLTLRPALLPAFTIDPSLDDNDYEAPLTASLNNETVSGLHWKWTTTGGKIDNDTAPKPSIHFTLPGSYTITLTAGNDKETKVVQQTITVLPNANLRTFSNVQFGINSAHASVGCFFSTKLQRSFKASDDLSVAGKDIDLVFFGLNQNFTYNRFVSPDSVGYYTFDAIPGAQPVSIINSQEQCGCASNLTVADFNTMTNDAILKGMPVDFTSGGWMQFTNNMVPRVVLFKTSDGRKGAVEIKQFVPNGLDSYIITDIKVQKSP